MVSVACAVLFLFRIHPVFENCMQSYLSLQMSEEKGSLYQQAFYGSIEYVNPDGEQR